MPLLGGGLPCRGDAAALLSGWCCTCFSLRRSAFCKQGIAIPLLRTHIYLLSQPAPPPPPFLLCTVSGILVSGTLWFSFPKERPLVSSKDLVGECIFWASRDEERTCGLIIPNMNLPLHPCLPQHGVLPTFLWLPWARQHLLHRHPLQRQYNGVSTNRLHQLPSLCSLFAKLRDCFVNAELSSVAYFIFVVWTFKRFLLFYEMRFPERRKG